MSRQRWIHGGTHAIEKLKFFGGMWICIFAGKTKQNAKNQYKYINGKIPTSWRNRNQIYFWWFRRIVTIFVTPYIQRVFSRHLYNTVGVLLVCIVVKATQFTVFFFQIQIKRFYLILIGIWFKTIVTKWRTLQLPTFSIFNWKIFM